MKKLSLVFAVMFMFVALFAAQAVAATYVSNDSGNWTTSTTWTGGSGTPGGTDGVSDTAGIENSDTVTLDSTVPPESDGGTVTTVTITDGTLRVIEGGALTATTITVASDGILQIGHNGVAGTIVSTTNIVGDDGELRFNHTNNATFANAVTGNLSLVRVGASNSTTTLSTGAKSFGTGTISVNSGTLEFASSNLAGTGNINVNGGTLKWAAGNTADGVSDRLNVDTGTLDIGGNVTFTNVPAVTGTLTKAGVGDLTLNGTIPGNWTVNAGTLILSENSNFSEADKTLLINPGAALEIVGDKMLTIGANAKLEIKKGGELVVGSDGAINLSALGSTVTLLSTSLDDFGGDAFDPDNPGRVFVNGGNDKGLKMTKALYDAAGPELLGFLVEDVGGIEIIDEPSPGRSSSGGCAATGFAPFAVLALLGMAALRRRS